MSPRGETKVLVIEDHPIVSDGCRRLLRRREDFIVREAASGAEGVSLNREFGPDVILLDIALPDANGLDMIEPLMEANADVRVVVFSMYQAPHLVNLALKKGARGYVTKNDDPNALLHAIDKVRAGSIYLGQAVAQALAMIDTTSSSDPLSSLDERQRRILLLMGDGKSITEISAELALGYKTVANAVASIKHKLGVPTTSALIKFAVELRSDAMIAKTPA